MAAESLGDCSATSSLGLVSNRQEAEDQRGVGTQIWHAGLGVESQLNNLGACAAEENKNGEHLVEVVAEVRAAQGDGESRFQTSWCKGPVWGHWGRWDCLCACMHILLCVPAYAILCVHAHKPAFVALCVHTWVPIMCFVFVRMPTLVLSAHAYANLHVFVL